MVSPSKFAHVVYDTHRYDEMVDWYGRVFEAHVQHADRTLTFMTYDDEHHRFAFVNLDVVKPGGAEKDRHGLIGIDHVAYTFGGLTELFDQYAALKAAGIQPYWCVHHGLTVSMYYADPDGNQMEFQVDCFATKQEAVDYFGSPLMEKNPVGVEFDPDEWLARLCAGTPAETLLQRQVHEPVSPIRGSFENAT
jgi:catechol-2,3-dioxygenase